MLLSFNGITFFNILDMTNVVIQLTIPNVIKNKSKYPDKANQNVNNVKNAFTVLYY